MEKCYVCGKNISPEEGDKFYVMPNGIDYACGCHASRTNRLLLDTEMVEKILEEKFGGTAIIRGEAEFIINYD